MWCRKDVGRVSVQDAVHDILKEGFEGGTGELCVWIGRDRETHDNYSSEQRGYCHCALAPNVRNVDGITSDHGTRDANDGSYHIVTVDCDGQRLRQKGWRLLFSRYLPIEVGVGASLP